MIEKKMIQWKAYRRHCMQSIAQKKLWKLCNYNANWSVHVSISACSARFKVNSFLYGLQQKLIMANSDLRTSFFLRRSSSKLIINFTLKCRNSIRKNQFIPFFHFNCHFLLSNTSFFYIELHFANYLFCKMVNWNFQLETFYAN